MSALIVSFIIVIYTFLAVSVTSFTAGFVYIHKKQPNKVVACAGAGLFSGCFALTLAALISPTA